MFVPHIILGIELMQLFHVLRSLGNGRQFQSLIQTQAGVQPS